MACLLSPRDGADGKKLWLLSAYLHPHMSDLGRLKVPNKTSPSLPVWIDSRAVDELQ